MAIVIACWTAILGAIAIAQRQLFFHAGVYSTQVHHYSQ